MGDTPQPGQVFDLKRLPRLSSNWARMAPRLSEVPRIGLVARSGGRGRLFGLEAAGMVALQGSGGGVEGSFAAGCRGDREGVKYSKLEISASECMALRRRHFI